MPLPLLILGGITIVSGIKYLDAKGRIKTAERIFRRHRQKYDSSVKRFEDWIKKVESGLEDLGKRRLESLDRLKCAAEFIRKAKVRDRDLEQTFNITPEILATWTKGPINAAEVVENVTKSIGAGTATALTAYGLVGVYGTATTGTAICSLTGVAAKNATIAWFGGGSIAAGGGGILAGTLVIGGLFVAPTALVASISKSVNSMKLETELEKKKTEMKVAQEKMDQQIEEFKLAICRIDEIHKSIEETDKALGNLLKKSKPENIEDAYRIAHSAKTLGELLDIPITDNSGNLITYRT